MSGPMSMAEEMERRQNIKRIVGDDGIREKKCLNEIQAVLKRFDCVMIPEVIIGGGQIQERLRVKAVPRVGAGMTQ